MNWKTIQIISEVEKEEVDVLIRFGDENSLPSFTVARWVPQKQIFQGFFDDCHSSYPLSFLGDNAYYINLKEILF